MKHEARQVVKGLKGLAKFKEMGRVVDERLFSVRLSHLPPAERAFIRAELLELKRMKSSTQKLYKTLVSSVYFLFILIYPRHLFIYLFGIR